ncbi:dinucleotide-utilizing protein [Leptospira langatensis]|uniref:Dinucleotide-utilizing protein n=1 Tax=Leptospira langatensis TaxID=2484983 RepID=A0A5F1ZQR7_9LEPT|nr:HesA/MoeB/ThiF family protein [Leptospira langatensis]TGK05487.1 dinucleotide-utilizing protein [Leptospira langatensis]TGL38623.1 dinucleotide-utilizing protein [Leptospira langatensis]
MDPEERKYFSRQIKLPFLGEPGQEKLRASSALVIGLGGLGSPASLHLATAGIGKIGLWDFDTIELSNLHRQTAFTLSDLGKRKTDITAQFLTARVPGLKTEIFHEVFGDPIDEARFDAWDIILDCTDQVPAKYAINRLAHRKKKPFVTASVFRTSAQISIFSPEGKPCYKCLYPDLDGSDLLSCAEGGVLGIQTAIAGMYQASLAIQYLLFPERSPTRSSFQIEWESPLVYEVEIQADPHCTVCGEVKTTSSIPKEEITFSEWISLQEDPNTVLLDIRELKETLEFPISNSIFFPLSKIDDADFSPFSKNKIYIAVCESGMRSKRAARILQEKGFKSYSLQGGRRVLRQEQIKTS